MKRVLIGSLALLVLAGCGSSPGEKADPAPSGSPSSSATATPGAWAQAKSILTGGRGRVGTFRTQVDLGPRGALVERGGYTIGPDGSSVERKTRLVDPKTGKSSTQVLSVIRTPDNSAFVMQTTGAAAHCWIPVTASELERDSSGQSPLPGAVLVLQGARVAEDPASTGKPMSVPGTISGLTALQALGFSLDEVDAAATAASETDVPITLLVAADGSPAGFTVDGKAVADALGDAGLPKAVSDLLPQMSARSVLSRLGTNPQIAAPPAASLAAPQGTCTPKS
ncbi:hypothetical protein [Marmoricola sp. RAF53]|uniref:hypothetical protein n=1 Tax=Marmoricola sp. RAF53 TaxID=3233059 RepID=UPI003F96E05C